MPGVMNGISRSVNWLQKLSMLVARRGYKVAEAVNACGTEGVHLSGTEKIELVQEITESVTSRLQQMLPAYLAGYSAGASAPVVMVVPPASAAPSQVTTPPQQQENDDAMPDFGDSCMDFDFIGG